MTNQIIQVPDMAIVTTQEGVKTLHSLRDQKLKKGDLHNFGAGSGVKHQGDLYTLDSGESIPIARMTTSKTNPRFTATANGSITVDWGDGTKNENVFLHTYTDNQENHDIVLYGKNDTLLILDCSNSLLSSLELHQNTALTHLACNANQLYQLDVTQNAELKTLTCGNNQLTQLITRNPKLSHLLCSNNRLSQMDTSPNTALTFLSCESNQLSELDISQNTNLKTLYLQDNLLSQLNVAHCPELNILDCTNNPFALNRESLIAMANSLADHTGQEAGKLLTNNAQADAIGNICSVKNWEVTPKA